MDLQEEKHGEEENFHGIKLTYIGHMSLKPDQQNISHQHLDPHLAQSDKAECFAPQPIEQKSNNVVSSSIVAKQSNQ